MSNGGGAHSGAHSGAAADAANDAALTRESSGDASKSHHHHHHHHHHRKSHSAAHLDSLEQHIDETRLQRWRRLALELAAEMVATPSHEARAAHLAT